MKHSEIVRPLLLFFLLLLFPVRSLLRAFRWTIAFTAGSALLGRHVWTVLLEVADLRIGRKPYLGSAITGLHFVNLRLNPRPTILAVPGCRHTSGFKPVRGSSKKRSAPSGMTLGHTFIRMLHFFHAHHVLSR